IRADNVAGSGQYPSAGVAPIKFVPSIATDQNKPDGLCVVPPRKVVAFLAPLPVGRLPGVGKVMQARLDALGVRTVADLRALPVAGLEQRFGRWGDRKSTRLNSSHVKISYAVFCLKK